MQEKLGNGFHSNCLNESQNNNFILIENPTKKKYFFGYQYFTYPKERTKESSPQDLSKITLITGWLSYHLLCYFMHRNFSKSKHNMLIHPV